MEVDYIAIGGRIRDQRHVLGLTQEALAERCGISFSFLGHIERGTRKMSLKTLVTLSDVLEISVDEIIFGADSSFCMKQTISELSSLRFRDSAQEASFCTSISALIHGIDAF